MMNLMLTLDEAMVPVYADVIISGKKTIGEVPEFGRVDKTFPLREKVKELLIERGYPDLAVEKVV